MGALMIQVGRPEGAVAEYERARDLSRNTPSEAMSLASQVAEARTAASRRPPIDHYKLMGLPRVTTEAEVWKFACFLLLLCGTQNGTR